MKEIWKEYQRIHKGNKEFVREISNQGRIRENGIIVNIGTDNLGYAWYKGKLVHRLVALYFIDNPDNKKEVDHINCIRDDNRVENLRWVSRLENCNNPITKNNLKEAMQRPEVKAKLSKKMKYYRSTTTHSMKGKIGVNNGVHRIYIEPSQLNEYLNKGYVRGYKKDTITIC